MLARLSSSRPLPGLVPLLLLCGVLAVSWIVTPDSHSQAPSAPAVVNAEAVNALVTKLKAQQALVAANQSKIEAQTALLAEEVRQAKIYSARIR